MQAHQKARSVIKSISKDIKVGLTLSLFDYQPVDGGEANVEKLWYEDFGFYLPFFRDDDFVGIQNYSRKLVSSAGIQDVPRKSAVTQMGYEDYPLSIGNVVRKAAKDFSGELIITENGIATDDDERRCEFIREAFESVMQTKADGVKVGGYFCWSLLDNFEWQAGYSKTFGLIAVDRKTLQRYPKKSLSLLGELAAAEI